MSMLVTYAKAAAAAVFHGGDRLQFLVEFEKELDAPVRPTGHSGMPDWVDEDLAAVLHKRLRGDAGPTAVYSELLVSLIQERRFMLDKQWAAFQEQQQQYKNHVNALISLRRGLGFDTKEGGEL